MIGFSANLGFLWTDRSLVEAIFSAKNAGFVAVECHWPYDTPAIKVKEALTETQLSMLGLNTIRGDVNSGEMGLSAVPGREKEALQAIEQAVKYAADVQAKAVHVMAGICQGKQAERTFIKNLKLACELARTQNLTILIEPLNPFDVPGYFLNSCHQAKDLISKVKLPNLKLMFDCYHVGRTEGDVRKCLNDMLPITGHIQFASVPDRGTPDHGDIDFKTVFEQISEMGWKRPLGAEYKPTGDTDSSLAWMAAYKD